MCIYQFLIAVRQDGNVLQNEDGETTRYNPINSDTWTFRQGAIKETCYRYSTVVLGWTLDSFWDQG